MPPKPLSSPELPARELQFCVRDCAVFKFRPPRAALGAWPSPTAARLLAATSDGLGLAPLAPGVIDGAVALLVGALGGGLAPPRALVYFEDPRSPPSADMLGQVVVVETAAHDLLAGRLLKGARRGLFDLEGAGFPVKDTPLRWAAHIRAILPPHQARRIPISGTSPADSRCHSRSDCQES